MSRPAVFHVLVISDDEDLRILLQGELETVRCRVLQTATLSEIPRLLDDVPIHVVLIDGLVDAEGIRRELDRQSARLLDAGLSVLVIVWSASVDGLRTHPAVDGVIRAPFSRDKLLSVVRHHVARAAERQGSHTRLRAAADGEPAADEDVAANDD